MDKSNQLKVTVLGCGGAEGVPTLGKDWGKCDPDNPKNFRMRNSLLVQKGSTNILIDCGPDLKHQINRLDEEVRHFDAVLVTHYHPDHISGIFELRTVARYNNNERINLYADEQTLKNLNTGYPYLFVEKHPKYPALFDTHIIDNAVLDIAGIQIESFVMDHGFCDTLGFIIDGKVAYCNDVVNIKEGDLQKMQDIEHFIIECTAFHEMPNHTHLDQALDWATQINAKNTYLTDLRKHMDYESLKAILPKNVEPCYDGMVIFE